MESVDEKQLRGEGLMVGSADNGDGFAEGVDNEHADIAAIMGLARLKRTVVQWSQDRNRLEEALADARRRLSQGADEALRLQHEKTETERKCAAAVTAAEADSNAAQQKLTTALADNQALKYSLEKKTKTYEAMLSKHREVTATLKIKLYEASEQAELQKKSLQTLESQEQIDRDLIAKLRQRFQTVADVVHRNTKAIVEINSKSKRLADSRKATDQSLEAVQRAIQNEQKSKEEQARQHRETEHQVAELRRTNLHLCHDLETMRDRLAASEKERAMVESMLVQRQTSEMKIICTHLSRQDVSPRLSPDIHESRGRNKASQQSNDCGDNQGEPDTKDQPVASKKRKMNQISAEMADKCE